MSYKSICQTAPVSCYREHLFLASLQWLKDYMGLLLTILFFSICRASPLLLWNRSASITCSIPAKSWRPSPQIKFTLVGLCRLIKAKEMVWMLVNDSPKSWLGKNIHSDSSQKHTHSCPSPTGLAATELGFLLLGDKALREGSDSFLVSVDGPAFHQSGDAFWARWYRHIHRVLWQ